MVKLLAPENWQPSEGISLTPASEQIVKETERNMAIIAGPGTGKTEILAQKASFLLQTGQCKYPQKILALCFKKDAARNLRIRVKKRCDSTLSRQFEAYTFDAFCSSIISRFSILFPEWTGFKGKAPPLPMAFDRNWLNGHNEYRTSLNKDPMRLKDIKYELDLYKYPQQEDMSILWQYCAEKNMLSYEMVFALAYTIIKYNPPIQNLLCASYHSIFLDEFQDTTDKQYQLLKLLTTPDTRVIAVGDNGQRIMVWAGAVEKIFEQFTNDYDADEKYLNINHRSNKEIVRFINHVLNDMFKSNINYESTSDADNGADKHSVIQAYQTLDDEANFIARKIKKRIEQQPLLAKHDFALIIKQRPDVYYKNNKDTFEAQGIFLRNENEEINNTSIQIQDLMTDSLSQFYILSLREKHKTITSEQYQQWEESLVDICGYNMSEDKDVKQFYDKQKNIRDALNDNNFTQEQLNIFIDTIGKHDIQNHCHYASEKILENHINAIWGLLQQALTRHDNNIVKALDAYEGINQVKLMSIHKSKGLEFDTVFFVDMHKDSWWSDQEAKECFFVGISRAKKKLYFTSDKPFHSRFAECLKNYEITIQ